MMEYIPGVEDFQYEDPPLKQTADQPRSIGLAGLLVKQLCQAQIMF